MVETLVSMRDVVPEVWKTDRIACHSFSDHREIKRAEAEALAKAATVGEGLRRMAAGTVAD